MKKQDIMEAAFNLFANQGYAGTSVQQIADAVGIQKPTLYSHFKSKLEIFKLIIKLQTAMYKEKVYNRAEDLKGFPIDDVLKQLFLKTVEFFFKREILLFWKQVYLQAAAKTNDESLAASVHMMKEIGEAAEEAFKKLLAGKDIPPEVFQQVLSQYRIIVHGFLDWMMQNMDSGKDIIKTASSYWDSMRVVPPLN